MKKLSIWIFSIPFLVFTSCITEDNPDEIIPPDSDLACIYSELLQAGELQFDFEGDTSGFYRTEGRNQIMDSYVSTEILASADLYPVSVFSRLKPVGFDGRTDFRITMLNSRVENTFELPGPYRLNYFAFIEGEEEEVYLIDGGKVQITQFNCQLIEGNFYASATTADGSKTIAIKNGYFRSVQ